LYNVAFIIFFQVVLQVCLAKPWSGDNRCTERVVARYEMLQNHNLVTHRVIPNLFDLK